MSSSERENSSDCGSLQVLVTREEMSSVKCDVKDTVRRRIPIISWLPYYTWDKLLQDCLAGLTVGLTAIPQGIAYAIVAGLPAQYGLYSGFVGCFVYLFLGGSKDITIGPTAIMALMSQSYTSRLGPDGVVLLCFLSGCVISAFGILQLGFLVDFISMPVTSGFTNAAAITIAASQLKSLIGLTGGGNSFIDSIRAVIENIKDTSLWDTVLGISSIALLVGLKQLRGDRRGSWVYKIIWVLSLARNAVVVILATVLAYIFYINGIEAFKLTGTIAEGLPPFGLPPFSICYNNRTYNFGETVSELGSSLISVPLIAILESIAIAKAFGESETMEIKLESDYPVFARFWISIVFPWHFYFYPPPSEGAFLGRHPGDAGSRRVQHTWKFFSLDADHRKFHAYRRQQCLGCPDPNGGSGDRCVGPFGLRIADFDLRIYTKGRVSGGDNSRHVLHAGIRDVQGTLAYEKGRYNPSDRDDRLLRIPELGIRYDHRYSRESRSPFVFYREARRPRGRRRGRTRRPSTPHHPETISEFPRGRIPEGRSNRQMRIEGRKYTGDFGRSSRSQDRRNGGEKFEISPNRFGVEETDADILELDTGCPSHLGKLRRLVGRTF
ncbi:sodium-independent sulfate anion transporter-like isoform X2 [Athalia rosae]|uniref:sodium-independent sulfate anion transporter-like isoform X2 n=1 Tax=Athalia rosae TaxID=37344 RepID=UPI00203447B5|nr:sodium-independent sulfate anion transporter-like isoform X2 [Athalia rosae]